MAMDGPRWLPLWLPLLLAIGLPLGACGGERAADTAVRSAEVVPPAAAALAPAPAPAATAPQPAADPDVTQMPDGSFALAPHVGDVAMLRRMPDGSFKRVCGPPDGEMRTMLEGMMRARRGGK